jgi:hypothetical protein
MNTSTILLLTVMLMVQSIVCVSIHSKEDAKRSNNDMNSWINYETETFQQKHHQQQPKILSNNLGKLEKNLRSILIKHKSHLFITFKIVKILRT